MAKHIRKEILLPLLIAALTLMFGPGIFKSFYYSPRLTYEILPTHTVNNQETHSIVINNKGKILLHNVSISIKATKQIDSLYVEGPEIMDNTGERYITDGKIGEKALQLRFSRFVMESKYTLTLLTEEGADINLVIVSDEIKAKQKQSNRPPMAMILILSAVFLAGLTYIGVEIFKITRLTTKNYCIKLKQDSGKKMKDFFDELCGCLQTIQEGLDAIESNIDKKEQSLAIIEKCKQAIKGLNDELYKFGKDIIVDGVCFDTAKTQKTKGEQ